MGEAPWLHMVPYGSMARLDMFPNFRQVASTITNGFIFQALVSVSLGNNDFFRTRSARRSLWIWYLHCIEIALKALKYLFNPPRLCMFCVSLTSYRFFGCTLRLGRLHFHALFTSQLRGFGHFLAGCGMEVGAHNCHNCNTSCKYQGIVK